MHQISIKLRAPEQHCFYQTKNLQIEHLPALRNKMDTLGWKPHSSVPHTTNVMPKVKYSTIPTTSKIDSNKQNQTLDAPLHEQTTCKFLASLEIPIGNPSHSMNQLHANF